MGKFEEAIVSVIVPVYNAELHLANCIESILAQTYQKLQLILINDGSTDSSAEICEKFAQNDLRVQVVHTENRGVSAARNMGIMAAEGKYICFVDADDTLPVDSVEQLYGLISSNDVQAVFGNYVYDFGHRIILRQNRITPGMHRIEDIADGLIDDGTLSGVLFGSVWGAIYCRELILSQGIKFRENLKINEDGIFNIEYCLKCTSIWYEPKAVYNYRQWKEGKRDVVGMEKLFDKTNKVLVELATNPLHKSVLSEGEKQLQARILFCIFQLSVVASSDVYKVAVSVLDRLWNNPFVEKGDSILNLAQTNVYKRALWVCIQRGLKRLFYLAIHYVYPLLKMFVRR